MNATQKVFHNDQHTKTTIGIQCSPWALRRQSSLDISDQIDITKPKSPKRSASMIRQSSFALRRKFSQNYNKKLQKRYKKNIQPIRRFVIGSRQISLKTPKKKSYFARNNSRSPILNCLVFGSGIRKQITENSRQRKKFIMRTPPKSPVFPKIL